MSSDTTIKKALEWAFSLLESISESAHLDAEVLMQYSLNKNRSYLYAWPEKLLSDLELKQFEQWVKKRVKGIPIAHIIGVREFWSLEFQVNATTLIPRPDTEILVETALSLPIDNNAKVLDLGTGTGAIALSIAHEKPNWQITAVDKIAAAVELACCNREKLGLDQVTILQSDWFDVLGTSQFDLIVSNPPYIDETDEHLDQGDVRFEPLTALTAAEKGYADLFYIANKAKKYLNNSGYLLMEHGYNQGEQLRQKMLELGYQKIKTLKDYGGNDRCTLGCWL